MDGLTVCVEDVDCERLILEQAAAFEEPGVFEELVAFEEPFAFEELVAFEDPVVLGRLRFRDDDSGL